MNSPTHTRICWCATARTIRVSKKPIRKKTMCRPSSATIISSFVKLPTTRIFDLEGLRGRLRSSSYAPTEGQPKFAPMMAELEQLFAANQRDNQVRMDFSCWVYLGQLNSDVAGA